MMDNLTTTDPVALRSLMTETLFGNGFEAEKEGSEHENLLPERRDVVAEQKMPAFLGGNERSYLFLINEPEHPFFAEADLEAFAKILAAKQMSMADVAVLNCAHAEANGLEQLIAWFKPKQVVFLGADPHWAGCDGISLNVPVQLAGIPVLFTYSFGEMHLQNEKKKVFWSLIKAI